MTSNRLRRKGGERRIQCARLYEQYISVATFHSARTVKAERLKIESEAQEEADVDRPNIGIRVTKPRDLITTRPIYITSTIFY
jgi:hypothetical protein